VGIHAPAACASERADRRDPREAARRARDPAREDRAADGDAGDLERGEAGGGVLAGAEAAHQRADDQRHQDRAVGGHRVRAGEPQQRGQRQVGAGVAGVGESVMAGVLNVSVDHNIM
jgi:hypothetical protein